MDAVAWMELYRSLIYLINLPKGIGNELLWLKYVIVGMVRILFVNKITIEHLNHKYIL